MSIKIGDSFSKLTVIDFIKNPNGGIKCKCQCECRNVKWYNRSALKRGNNKSCGCLNHGMAGTRLYVAWTNMKRRCNDPTNKSYHSYGGRGISYDVRWDRFINFYEDMKDGYADDLTLDRVDVESNYSKSNCRWVDMTVQGNNTTTNRLVTYKGETLTMSETARKHDITVDLLKHRLYAGWSIDDSIEKPIEQETIIYKGETKTVSDWAKEKGMTYHQLKKRLMRGWTVERAIEQPLRKSPNRN